jgi:transposase
MINKLSEEEIRSMLSEGQTLYKISRKFDMVIKEVFKLGRSYGIHFAYDHDKIPRPSKEDLESMYHDEHLTQHQIASEFGVTDAAVSVWVIKYNLQTIVPRPYKEIIERMYIKEGMSQRQIAKEFDVSQAKVYRWMGEYNIPTRGVGTLRVTIPPKEVIERMYTKEGMSQRQIAKEFNVNQAKVCTWLREYNIPIRCAGAIAFQIPPKDDLLNCIADGLNQHQITEKYNVCDSTIFRWCEYYGIPGMVNKFRFTTDEHIEWRDAVLDRDNYICQECGGFGDVLHAHHIKPYHDYPELELDIDNGITLCERCHKQTFGREYHYIVKYEDIVLRDRCIGDDNYD